MSTTPPIQVVPSYSPCGARSSRVSALKEKIETGLFVICCVRLAESLIESAVLERM